MLRKQRDALDDQIQRLEWQLRYGGGGGAEAGSGGGGGAESGEEEPAAVEDMLANLKEQVGRCSGGCVCSGR